MLGIILQSLAGAKGVEKLVKGDGLLNQLLLAMLGDAKVIVPGLLLDDAGDLRGCGHRASFYRHWRVHLSPQTRLTWPPPPLRKRRCCSRAGDVGLRRLWSLRGRGYPPGLRGCFSLGQVDAEELREPFLGEEPPGRRPFPGGREAFAGPGDQVLLVHPA